MPFTAVELKPGVDTQRTLSLNQAGVSVSQLIRYKEGLISVYGGWEQYVPTAVPSTVRDLHAWLDAAGNTHLAAGATNNLIVITAGSNQDIVPQAATTNFTPNFSISSGLYVVTITDNNSSGLASVYNTIFFNTPIALGNLLLNGAYDIATVVSSIQYTIISSVAASTTIASSGILPIFTTSSGSAIVTVLLPNNGFQSIPGLFYPFYAATSVGGLTIQGPYQIQTIIDSTTFTINSPTQATSGSTVTMNNGQVQLVYYVTQGPTQSGTGYSFGGYGSGGYGTGVVTSGAAGTPISTTDWTMDNWGQTLIACPKDGPIFTWSPDDGFATASVITEAPFRNGGIFISMPQQILVAWKSCQSTGAQGNLIVRWSDAEDYTNWTVSNQTSAGSFVIPTGSVIRGGMQGASQGFIWTDVDVWVMQYVGGIVIFNFTRVGSGCGLVGPQAMGTLNGQIYWMGVDNFFMIGGKGVETLPCSVWDFVFQNLNASPTNVLKTRCATNSDFNEVTWFFPSAGSAGENDSFVKYNITEGEWDYGMLPRTAWTDVSVLGHPIGADVDGTLFQHEIGNVTAGVSNPAFRTGWWTITEGSDLAFVDFIIPDFKYGTYSGAQNANVTLTFFSVNYPGETPIVHGPYVFGSGVTYITPRIRGRLLSVLVEGDGASYWRLGRIRYRYAVAGRR